MTQHRGFKYCTDTDAEMIAMSWLQLQSALAVLAFVAGNSYPPIKPSVHYDYPDIPWPLPSKMNLPRTRRAGRACVGRCDGVLAAISEMKYFCKIQRRDLANRSAFLGRFAAHRLAGSHLENTQLKRMK